MSQSTIDDIPSASPSAAGARADVIAAVRPAPELTIVVPTFNEQANIPLLVERLSHLLTSCDWEVIFVDDNSPDGTAAAARTLGELDSRVRCIRRIGRRGLAGACLEGMLASQARYVAVMDADLQHDEGLLVPMLEALRGGRADVAVASRYLYGGSAAGLSKQRSRVSRGSNAHRAPPARDRAHRSDERAFHDPAGSLRGDCAWALFAGFQDSARHLGDGARQSAHDRTTIHLPRTPARREQARFKDRARFRRAW